MGYVYVAEVDKMVIEPFDYFVYITEKPTTRFEKPSGVFIFCDEMDELFEELGMKNVSFAKIASINNAYQDVDGEIFFKNKEDALRVANLLQIQLDKADQD